jgi:heat shock protein HslJ
VKKYLLILFVTSLALSACASQESSTSLIGTWNLTSYGPAASQTPAVADSEAKVTFNEDGTVVGSSGCNGFGGNYTVEGDQIKFDQITSNLMACDAARMAQEDAVHQVLTETATYTIEGNTLTITNNDRVLVFTRGAYP